MTEQPPPNPRFVTNGRMEGDLFVITLDGSEDVETDDEAIAQAAATSRSPRRPIDVQLEAQGQGRRKRLTELRLLQVEAAVPAATPQAPAATNQAIARIPDLPHGIISNAVQLAEQLTAMQRHYTVLSPAIAVSELAPGYGANMALVQIDSTLVFDKERKSGTGPHCYYSKFLHQGDEQKRSLNKEGLLKICQAAGIQWDPMHTRRLDNGRERHYWRWQYYGGIRTHDGQWQPLMGTRELDLRDGSDESRAMASDNQRAQARARGNEICETKAMERAIRTLGIKQAYTVEDLRKPFLIVRFSFTPDMNDPEIKKLVTERAMSGMGQMYPAPSVASALPALPSHEDDIEDAMPTADPHAPKPERPRKANPFATDTSSASPATSAAAVTVAKVDKRQGKNNKGNTWTLYKVTFSTGEVAATFSETLHQLIDDALAQKAPVRYAIGENPGYDDKLESFAIIDTRQGDLLSEPKGGY